MFAKKFCFGEAGTSDYIHITEAVPYSNELGYGFVYDMDDDERKMQTIDFSDTFCYGTRTDVPLRFDVRVPDMGTYNVRVTVFDAKNDTTMSILSEWRRFIRTDKKIPAGERYTCDFTVNVCDIHHTDEERYIDRVLNLAFLGDAKVTSIEITETDAPTIYIAGDSTVTDQSTVYPYNPKSSYCGWGQRLGEFLKLGVAVSNHAESGKTTATFMGNLWSVVKERIKAGDYLFMGFGHNDQKVEELGAFSGYYNNLLYYIDYARSVGAIPVLCTPINRIIFEPDGSLRDLLGEYGAAVRKLAKEKNVPYIDLLKKTTEYFVAQGSVRAWNYFWGDGENRDYTHTNDLGARIIAQFVAQGIIENDIQPLAGFVRKNHINVPFPEPIKSEGVSEPAKGVKPLEQVGLVNVPKLVDLSGLDNEDVVRELAAKGCVDAVDENRFAADELLSVRSAAKWSAGAAGVGEEIELDGIPPTDEPITREQLACLLVASYNLRAPDRAIVGSIDKYGDRAEINPLFLDGVRAANELGVLAGETDSVYNPCSVFKRGEAADIFYRLIRTK